MPRIMKTCPCGKTFETSTARERGACSVSCANRYLRGYQNSNFTRVDRRDEKHYAAICWAHHPKRCVVCSEERVVAVHHYNENHDDNRPENLVPLCPTHHTYWHSQYRSLIKEVVDKYVHDFIQRLPVVQQIERHASNVNVAGANPAGETMHTRYMYEGLDRLAFITVFIDGNLRAVLRPPMPEVSSHHQWTSWIITSLYNDPVRQECEDIIKRQPEYKGEVIRAMSQFGETLKWKIDEHHVPDTTTV